MKKNNERSARILFMAGYTIDEVAKTLRLSPHSVSKMSAKGNWGKMRTKENLLEENTHTKLTDVFAFQVECLHKIATDRRESEDFKPLKAGDFDGLQKMFSTIKPQWRQFQSYAVIVKEFVDFCQSENLEVGKVISQIGKKFLYEKNKVL